jgi:hypothetical protein
MLHWITLKIVPPRGPRLLFLVIFPHREREREATKGGVRPGLELDSAKAQARNPNPELNKAKSS